VSLNNGDRLEGFMTRLADPLEIEISVDGTTRTVEIPIARASGAALVTARRPSRHRRVWFRDGTVLDAGRLGIGDDGYVRLETTWTDGAAAPGDGPMQIRLTDVSAMLFDPGAMIPLTGLEPARIEATAPRFRIPPPRVLDADAPLGLGRIEYRGPLLVRYALPPGCRRFAARASLAPDAREWGDLDLIVRDENTVVYEGRLSAENPTATINVALHGSELTIELGEGAYGPIQDRLLLTRAMLLVE